jgi:hypothetical protein
MRMVSCFGGVVHPLPTIANRGHVLYSVAFCAVGFASGYGPTCLKSVILAYTFGRCPRDLSELRSRAQQHDLTESLVSVRRTLYDTLPLSVF